jgi:hypothetical protein
VDPDKLSLKAEIVVETYVGFIVKGGKVGAIIVVDKQSPANVMVNYGLMTGIGYSYNPQSKVTR